MEDMAALSGLKARVLSVRHEKEKAALVKIPSASSSTANALPEASIVGLIATARTAKTIAKTR
jgi:hypothetical protein